MNQFVTAQNKNIGINNFNNIIQHNIFYKTVILHLQLNQCKIIYYTNQYFKPN